MADAASDEGDAGVGERLRERRVLREEP